jgi:hypothetical protein
MADISQLESALVKADAAGNADDARALAAEIRRVRATAPSSDVSDSSLVGLGAGLGKGFGTVALNAQKYLGKGLGAVGADSAGQWLVNDADQGLKKIQGEVNPYRAKSPIATGAGELGGEIVATLPVGGVLGKAVGAGAKAISPSVAAAVQPFVNALTTGGFKAGTNPGALNMLTRAAGGAATGGVSAGLVNPIDAGTGAVIGAALPPALSAAGKVAGYAGRAAGSLVKPFTASGQEELAGNIIKKFAEGGPTAVDARQIVPGSTPTLAEATGNAGIATLQRATRDLRPNAFAEREAANATARNAAFEDVAGDTGKLDFFRADRASVGSDLYKQALSADVSDSVTPYIKGQITQLLKRPSINDASKAAQKLALERGEKPAAMGSLPALHDVKTVIDDRISEAVRRGAGGEAQALQATKDKLLDVMEKLSPDYATARQTYAEMSKPVNAMEVLQGLKLTDAQGNMTLAKVQGALSNLEKAANAPGANNAKSVSGEQMETLRAIRDDLLRQSNLSKGKSIGSNTFQNIATDNILNSLAGNTLSNVAGKLGIAGVAGQVGRLAYSGPNEAIRNRLADMMLQPELANAALNAPAQIKQNALSKFLANQTVQQPLYRAAPLLTSGQ